jgi:hypothetical protein
MYNFTEESVGVFIRNVSLDRIDVYIVLVSEQSDVCRKKEATFLKPVHVGLSDMGVLYAAWE